MNGLDYQSNYAAQPGYPWFYPMPSENEKNKRWQAVKDAMAKEDLDLIVFAAPFGYMCGTNTLIYYISNFMPFFNRDTYVVFPRTGEPQIIVSNAIGPQFRHCALEISWIKDVISCDSPIFEVVQAINRLNINRPKIGITGYNAGIFSATAYITLKEKLPGAIFQDCARVLNEAMNKVSRNSTEELGFLKTACKILDASFDAVASTMKPGVKECELWAVAEQAIISNGGWYGNPIFATSAASPIFPRGPASHRMLEKGDVVIFEMSSIFAGISPQICYALSIGKPAKEIETMFSFCDELYAYALDELEKAQTFEEIELKLINKLQSANYEPMTPQMHRYNRAGPFPKGGTPQPGDYLTVHPNICNKDYTGGAKFGDTVRIESNGKIVRLMSTPARLNIV